MVFFFFKNIIRLFQGWFIFFVLSTFGNNHFWYHATWAKQTSKLVMWLQLDETYLQPFIWKKDISSVSNQENNVKQYWFRMGRIKKYGYPSHDLYGASTQSGYCSIWFRWVSSFFYFFSMLFLFKGLKLDFVKKEFNLIYRTLITTKSGNVFPRHP